jgi:hypothetical protein
LPCCAEEIWQPGISDDFLNKLVFFRYSISGTDIMIFQIFSLKNFAKKIAVFDSKQS